MKVLLAVLITLIGIASGSQYSHSYDTFDFKVSTPLSLDFNWGSSDGDMIFATLPNNEDFFVWNGKFYDWEPRDTSKENLVKIWARDADENQYSEPTITKLDNGDYVITGRMIRMSSMITRSERTFDFDGDGLLDWHTTWNIDGKYDYSTIENLAASTNVIKVQPKWD